MLNPVVMLPIPAALAVLGLVAALALGYLENRPTYPTWPAAPAKPRHRQADQAAPPLVPAIEEPTQELEIPYDPLDHRWPLAEVERRMAAHVIQDAREMATV